MKSFLRSFGGPILMLIVLGAAVLMLHRELRHYDLHDFANSLRAIPRRAVFTAAGLTIVSYLVLSGYELLGAWYLERNLGFRRVAVASLLGYALAYNLGPLLGGATIRYRLYTTWGLSAIEITKLILLLAVTFWCGVALLGGSIFTALPLPVPSGLHLPVATTRPLGVLLGIGALVYIAVCALYRRPLRIGQWEFAPPPVWIALLQFVVAAMDLSVAASVLYVLLPASLDVPYVQFLGVYLLAIIAALVTQIPGGLGVLELVILLLLSPAEPQRVVGSLLAFRAIYFLFPLGLALVILTVNEVALHRKHAGRLVVQLGQWTEYISPPALAIAVFLAGAVLLFAGGTPAEPRQLGRVMEWIPLAVKEASHFFSSIIGILLIVLAYDLQRRVRAAYNLTLVLLVAGLAASMLKGLGYEEGIVLAVTLGFLLPSRSHFFRRGQLLTEKFSPRWLVAIAFVLGCTVWLMVLSYDSAEYRHELWWQFTAEGNVSRSLRAAAGVLATMLVVGGVQRLRARPSALAAPTPADLLTTRQLVARSPHASAHLALLGDKRLLFNRDHSAMIMYAVHRRSWISMGDPVGPSDAARDLAWTFREMCDQRNQRPVFYQVREDRVKMYVEMGLTLIKLGEEARVFLPGFGVDSAADLVARFQQRDGSGLEFRLMEPPLDDSLMDDLRRVSDAWRGQRGGQEMRFSMGYFQQEYLRECPVALAQYQGKIVGFANLWIGADQHELSIDMLRFLPEAPDGILDFLFIRTMLWGKEQGYQWFPMGMTPLAAMEDRPVDPIWRKAASIAFQHGQNFSTPQRLRKFKERFDPVWTSAYLAAPETFALPVIVADIAALVSGDAETPP